MSASPTHCAFCEAPFDAVSERLAGRIVCARCAVATTDPWPTDAELDAAYGGAYRPEAGRFSGPGDKLLARTRATLARRIDAIAPPGPVLDVGAGDGTLVRALRDRGRDAVGLEREARGEHLRDQELEEVLDGPYAAIVLWHALEHLRAPGRALDHAATLLAPGGVLVVAVPNAGSLQARLFRDDWLALDLPRHLTHIPAGALVARLEAAGLELERASHWRGGQIVFGWLHGLVGRLPGHPSLYDAVRRPEARWQGQSRLRRALTLGAGAALLPVALVATAAEVAARRGGSIHVEARRRTRA